jgi:hypothetical protein
MNKVAISTIPVRKPCPFCNGKAVLKRWNQQHNREIISFTVECKKCRTHSIEDIDPIIAVKNWRKEEFTPLMVSLNHKLDIDDVTESSVIETISAILMSTSGEFREMYEKYLDMSPSDKRYIEHKLKLETVEKELKLTINYWKPNIDADDTIARIKADIKRERGIK